MQLHEECYGQNICVFPRFVCWNLIPSVLVLWGRLFEAPETWRWSPHERDDAWTGDLRGPACLPHFCHSKSQREDCCQWRRWFSPDTKSDGTLTLNFLASRTLRNNYLLFKTVGSLAKLLRSVAALVSDLSGLSCSPRSGLQPSESSTGQCKPLMWLPSSPWDWGSPLPPNTFPFDKAPWSFTKPHTLGLNGPVQP